MRGARKGRSYPRGRTPWRITSENPQVARLGGMSVGVSDFPIGQNPEKRTADRRIVSVHLGVPISSRRAGETGLKGVRNRPIYKFSIESMDTIGHLDAANCENIAIIWKLR